jgi:hypothetical protein
MHLEKLREKPRVMAAEVGKNTAVGVLREEFADQFTGQHHAVRDGRLWAALAERTRLLKIVGQKIVGEAEHSGDEIVKSHGRQVVEAGSGKEACTYSRTLGGLPVPSC